jgi:hypothetical protein
MPALKLEEKGLELKAGQSVSFLITKYRITGMNRATPARLSPIQMNVSGINNLLSPFRIKYTF